MQIIITLKTKKRRSLKRMIKNIRKLKGNGFITRLAEYIIKIIIIYNIITK